ncbi:MAG: phenylalanine--tRNA ligase subunit beta [Chloroflexia bacterium]|nr:phenylalanine--tRNA ligase subunit beta [Chloroflexia bacterium]
MNVPYRWLQQYVDTDLAPEVLARRMTMAGLEAEKLTRIGAEWDKVYVGEVMSVTPHPDADRLVLADVAAGEHRLTVVTGAPNIAEGQKVALALAGARLIDAYADEVKYNTLKPGSIRGVRSEGMVCSEKELGMSEEHEGILVLEQDAPLGVPLADYLGDTVIEFEITPNLVHAFSIFGIAREAGAITGARVREPALADLSTVARSENLVRIDAPDLCRRYHVIVLDGVKVEPSPSWMVRRLQAAGVRPVNNLVDVTNYVMLELGQPLHAFDLSFVEGERISVRRARPGELFKTLDHRQRTLEGGELLICDAVKPVGLAGIMGGVNSEIVDTTTSLLLEAATFDMVSVRRTARAQKLQTDASARFGRGLDPELPGVANARAAQLILELCPQASIRTVQDVYPDRPQSRTISFQAARVSSLLGMAVEPDEMVAALEGLQFQPVHDSETGILTVTVPSWRTDVTMREDVIEEIARIVGYEKLPATLITGTTPSVERDPLYLAEGRVRALLVAAGGYEGRGYITVSDADLARWSLDAHGGFAHSLRDAPMVRLRNAIPAEDNVLRPSLIPGLAKAVDANLKHERTVRLFEIGHVYLGTDPNLLPSEPSTLAIALAGQRETFDRFSSRPTEEGQLDYFDAKGMIDAVIETFGPDDVTWRPLEHPALHPGRAAEIRANDERIGIVAEVHPTLAGELGIEGVRFAVAELNLQRLLDLAAQIRKPAVAVARFLPVEQDFAIVVDRAVRASDVQRTLRQNAGPLLTGMTLFDVYEGEQIGDGKKSLAYRITFTAPDRALTDAELAKVRKRIERGLQTQVNGSLRA